MTVDEAKDYQIDTCLSFDTHALPLHRASPSVSNRHRCLRSSVSVHAVCERSPTPTDAGSKFGMPTHISTDDSVYDENGLTCTRIRKLRACFPCVWLVAFCARRNEPSDHHRWGPGNISIIHDFCVALTIKAAHATEASKMELICTVGAVAGQLAAAQRVAGKHRTFMNHQRCYVCKNIKEKPNEKSALNQRACMKRLKTVNESKENTNSQSRK
uniref:SFRICE_023149 n=1 Tax=Spodoptera frugiperda TaxID=7108 RepID=A0A2H1W9R1_SPOFR